MSQYDTTNTAVAFVENGIFSKSGVEALQAQRKPIIKVKVNVDGKDVEIALYFAMEYDDVTNTFTNRYKVTKSGNKMLKGKVEAPYVSAINNAVSNERTDMDKEFDDEIPF